MLQQSWYSCEKKQSIGFLFVLRVPGFLDSDEAPLLERLIEAYREKDSDALEQCCNDAVFRSMDTEVQAQPYTLTFSLFPRIFQHAVNLGIRNNIWCLKKVGLSWCKCTFTFYAFSRSDCQVSQGFEWQISFWDFAGWC